VREAQQGRGTIGHLVQRFHLVNYVSQHAPQLESAQERQKPGESFTPRYEVS